MKIERFCEILGADFYTGVPDSQLKALCNYLMDTYGVDGKHHIIAANEGNCTALAAGYHLATGKTPVVYMQNSGQGNVINPVASLLNEKVYAIPMIFVIGWRGEPGVHDEPQHIYQGEVTLRLLEDMNIRYFVIGKDTSDTELSAAMASGVDFVGIAKACGYPYAVCVADETTLDKELLAAKNRGELSFIEIRCAIGSRADLGRPTTTPVENKERVMAHLIQPHRQ